MVKQIRPAIITDYAAIAARMRELRDGSPGRAQVGTVDYTALSFLLVAEVWKLEGRLRPLRPATEAARPTIITPEWLAPLFESVRDEIEQLIQPRGAGAAP
jgi:hypothetical protein